MKTLIVATIPTHHTSSALRSLNLKHYKKYPTGVHQTVEDFKTLKDANNHLEGRDTKEVNLKILVGLDREEYREYNYLDY